MPSDLTPEQREFFAILDRSQRLVSRIEQLTGPRWTAEMAAYLEPAPRERSAYDDL